ncbi:hypothetical protein JZ751_024946, partial [Albula glossodonta]
MFENSSAAHPTKLQAAKSAPALNRRSFANTSGVVGAAEGPGAGGLKTGSSQHLKNALNLGKAVGARMNDLLRRKDPSALGDIGVTEVNKNVGAVWTCMDGSASGITANSHVTLDSFPRLDPPPPTNKKRLPRALKTTQDMMISSDPVVTTPEASDSFLSPPDRDPLLQKDMPKQPTEEGEEGKGPAKDLGPTLPLDRVAKDEDGRAKEPNATTLDGSGEDEGEELSHLLRSVPDLIHKDNLDPRQKLGGVEVRMASTPCPGGKPNNRISVGEDDLQDNGSEDSGVPRQRTSSMDNEEPHPDL